MEGKVKCPVCGEMVDLSDEKRAMVHVKKDDVHREYLEESEKRRSAQDFIDMAVGSGIMRRVG